ncbi:MICAL-like protein 1 [Brachionichthys hirsutus]|uniref:MICAL-like protein 1 n=1 Tax=Brachionichthys hirsutus TaxID=412623 RepID=UPI00360474BE
MSDLSEDVPSSPKALRDWCRVTCAHYPCVEIKNMSTSFRDGLAFCAIIHKHRPDLIDYSSLCKENAYQNNKLAFETAEMKLGIPALLDPKEMVSTRVPDSLSVITYLSQYYYFFNRTSYGLASLRSSHVTVLNNLTSSRTPDILKPDKNATHLVKRRDDRLPNTRSQTVCSLCFKPVHLIQRHFIDSRVYHRSCFRCKLCHSTLLRESYKQGRDPGSLICTHHTTGRTSPNLHPLIGSTENRPRCAFRAAYFSLGGLPITSVPHYPKATESQDRLVCQTAAMEGEVMKESGREVRDGENKDFTSSVKRKGKRQAPVPPSPDKAAEPIPADSKAQREPVMTVPEPPERSSSWVQVTEGSSQLVPPPVSSSVDPVLAPRTKPSQAMDSPPAAGGSSSQNKSSSRSIRGARPTGHWPKVNTKHPWLTIIHPGPWAQLPPAPALQSKPASWYRPKVRASNPFGEDLDRDTLEEKTAPEAGDQTDASVAATHSGNEDSLAGSIDAASGSGESAGDTSHIDASDAEETGDSVEAQADVAEEATGGSPVDSAEAQSRSSPSSLPVSDITPAQSQPPLLPADTMEANEEDEIIACQSPMVCSENPFDQKDEMPQSSTFSALPFEPAPAHGFPLIKRKVQTDQNISTEGLQVEIKELDKQLEAMEQRGVELERDLRARGNDKEEEQMLKEWFSLIHERHILVRRDTELVHLTTQQKLEEKQADVEYMLRCLLNKPESDWSPEEQRQERQLMDELVAVIEQRNQIICNLDQDKQRERGEDLLLGDIMKNKELQKEGLKELKKSKGKFKLTKVFKMMHHKDESTKQSTDKQS